MSASSCGAYLDSAMALRRISHWNSDIVRHERAIHAIRMPKFSPTIMQYQRAITYQGRDEGHAPVFFVPNTIVRTAREML